MAKIAKTWQDLEVVVRIIASHLYNREAVAKEVNGIRCDAVLEIEHDNFVVIEVSKDNSLAKLRVDLAKFATLKQFYNLQNLYVKCIFICDTELHPSLVETAKGLYVEALTIYQFSEKLFNFRDYTFSRLSKPFGSAVDPVTGENDNNKYTRVTYFIEDHGEVSIDYLCDLIVKGKYIVLTGEYGSGKSRCLKELFKILVEKNREIYKFPIHINLKENWGLKRSTEILSRHIGELGLNRYLDSLIKVGDKSSVCYLLDGFDEVGAQTWSDTPEKLRDIRKQTLAGIKDLLQNSKGGGIVSGREHYFKNSEELVQCLGLEKKNPVFVQCKPEFSESEVKDYLDGKTNISRLPEWLPKKPLLCQIIREIDVDDLSVLFNDQIAEFDFFNVFIDLVTERETRINPILDKDVIKSVMVALSEIARKKDTRYGPISISELNKTFENITGSTVADETAIILQRLPGLGRINGSSNDRQFIDDYIFSGLQALNFIQIVSDKDTSKAEEIWTNSLGDWSIQYLGSMIHTDWFKSACIHYLTSQFRNRNKVLIGELLSAVSLGQTGDVNLNNIILDNISCPTLDLSNGSVSSFTLEGGYIDRLIIEDKDNRGIKLKSVCINQVDGISAIEACPDWISGCLIDAYQEVNNLSQIKKSKLNDSQKLFILLTRKLFMQPGGGRKEAALYKGFESQEQKKEIQKILHLMAQHKLFEIAPGNEGRLYIPNRKLKHRIQLIHNELILSKDDIWQAVSKMG